MARSAFGIAPTSQLLTHSRFQRFVSFHYRSNQDFGVGNVDSTV